MGIFSELNLMECTFDPLRYTMLRSGKVSLEASPLRSRLIRMKGLNGEGGIPD